MTDKTLNLLSEREDTAIDTCTTCPKLCRWACPVAEAEARETTSPHNLVTLAGFVKRGQAPLTAAAQLPYHCSQCGACTEACLHKNDVPMVLSAARARLVSAHLEPEAIGEVRGHFAVAANPYGVSLEPALEEIGAPKAKASEAIYLPGCATLAELPEAAEALFRALAIRGIADLAIHEASGQCCGLPLYWAGDLGGFRAHAERYAEKLEDAPKLVVHDAACFDAMTRLYRQVGVNLRPPAVHLASFLAEALGLSTAEEQAAPGAPREGRVAYLDTCHAARNARAVEAPRALLERATGSPPAERCGLRGASADCCGAAGLLPKTAPETARAMAEARLAELRASGAEEMAVLTPRCAAHLRRVDPTAPVLDVCSFLARLS
ncbi:MAG: (Fe-S)-binding protein [Myxococcota bacterium]